MVKNKKFVKNSGHKLKISLKDDLVQKMNQTKLNCIFIVQISFCARNTIKNDTKNVNKIFDQFFFWGGGRGGGESQTEDNERT